MRIFTFFDCTPNISGQGEIIRHWRDSWQKRGWEPVILNPRTYVKSPFFKDFCKEVASYVEPVTRCRHLRWLALETVGGGWMSEYDVMNFGPVNHPLTDKWRRHSHAHFGLSLVHLTARDARRVVKHILAGGHEFSAFHGIQTDVWPEVHRDFGLDGWEMADTVHFGSDLLGAMGVVAPKHRVIETCGRVI